jgi:hypothetical protein
MPALLLETDLTSSDGLVRIGPDAEVDRAARIRFELTSGNRKERIGQPAQARDRTQSVIRPLSVRQEHLALNRTEERPGLSGLPQQHMR